MGKLLGIDTGGTYTDAVLFDEETGVVAAAKDLTTKHDLMIGVSGAVAKVLDARPDGEAIRLVSLSTTLATNAIVEGHGGAVCLVLIGFDKKALDKAGLREALGDNPVVFLEGGHNALGEETKPLDLAALEAAITVEGGRVAAVAIAGFFGVRNPDHEIRARALVREKSGLPVTCSHELTSNLDAPRRALTALLNARLIPQLQQLILAVRQLMDARGIDAPLMVVKGDGSLVADDVALTCPVETILSGPAASVVGARYLSGEQDVVVSDIGGTTTDIAILKNGRPQLDREGARVGGWRTMVEAVRVHTFGLGGDSEVGLTPPHSEGPPLLIGPRRVVPLSLLCQEHPSLLSVLEEQAARLEIYDFDGRFVMRLRPRGGIELPRMEQRLWDELADGPQPLETLAPTPALMRPLRRLVDRGLAVFSGFSPSDAAHILGLQETWCREAAVLGARLFARFGRYSGRLPVLDVEDLARMTFERVVVQTGHALIEASLVEAGEPTPRAHGAAIHLVERALLPPEAKEGGILNAAFALGRPLAAIGAPADTYYPEVARRLGTRLVSPDHGDVCNAVGAVAGGVFQAVRVLVTQPQEGRFRVHLSQGIADYPTLEAAREVAEGDARSRARDQAIAAGAAEIELSMDAREVTAKADSGDELFFELEVTATAFGRPRLATG